MTLIAGYASCDNCNPKDAYSLRDDTGKGICVGRLKKPKIHKSDKYSICFIPKTGHPTRYVVTRSELQMLCAAANFLLLLEEIGKWNKHAKP